MSFIDKIRCNVLSLLHECLLKDYTHDDSHIQRLESLIRGELGGIPPEERSDLLCNLEKNIRLPWASISNEKSSTEINKEYEKVLGKTLYNVFLNLGLEPPTSLPKDDSEITGTNSSASDNYDEPDAQLSAGSTPVQLQSPRTTRLQVRHALPRALFTDMAIVAAAAAATSNNTDAHHSKTATTSTCIKNQSTLTFTTSTDRSRSTRTVCSKGMDMASFNTKVSSATPATAVAQPLVLITSQRSRRKGRTPTKRTTPVHSSRPRPSRRSKLIQTPPSARPSSSSRRSITPHRSGSKASAKNGTHSAERRRVAKHSKSATVSKNQSNSVAHANRSTNQETPKRRRSGSGRRLYHRSVHETPNPERSYPRWERARLAAAEKTKNKAIVVDESPIKPLESLGSPLRRLKRANSMLIHLYYMEAHEASVGVGGGVTKNVLSGCLSQSSSLPPDADHSGGETNTQDAEDELSRLDDSARGGGGGGGCMSVAMSRAERWRRKRFEEEASLSQFSQTQPVTLPSGMKTPPPSNCLRSPMRVRFTPSSGLLCFPGGLRRHNSNLFANMTSPEAISPQSPGNVKLKTPRKSIFRGQMSPPNGGLQSPKRATLVDTTAITAPSRFIHHRLSTSPLSNIPQQPALSPHLLSSPPRTTPRRRRRNGSGGNGLLPQRTRHTSASSSANAIQSRDIPVSPQVFDEDAMFLGRDEFLNETNTSSASRASPWRTGSYEKSDNDENSGGDLFISSKRRRVRLQHSSAADAPILRLAVPCSQQARSDTAMKLSSQGIQSNDMSHLKNLTGATRQHESLLSLGGRPSRSPFAPLHVFNRPTGAEMSRGVLTSDLMDNTTNMSSQSASAVVALRTRLFGNSSATESSPDTTCSHQPPGPPTTTTEAVPTTRSPVIQSARNTSSSRHVWDESSSELPPVSPKHLRRLRHSARGSMGTSTTNSGATRRVRVSTLVNGVAGGSNNKCSALPSVRPRRSLFQ